ncbi:5-nucleotidase [Schleiferilactobacillus perolens DSM 12744]|uniref:5-nucleotidase n=2 Tax=Schleiferilactobacillus perolens TaxID=100468 RepID=A0A0R1MP89_9LACO|nr:5-nucleotidase [Schleiferilactobacillus perolens DSM 12744]
MDMTTIFFDFDGTIVDSQKGIVHGLKYMVEKLALTPLTADQYRLFIGPPLTDSLHQFYPELNDSAVVQAIRAYKEFYDQKGLYELQMYPGITDVLARLQAAGFSLNVASTKPTALIQRLAAHLQLDHYFTGLFGATEDERIRSSKTDILAYGLEKLGANPATSIMIGDRNTDMIGGKNNHVATIGVLYGFGSRTELTQAGASVIVAKPNDISGAVHQLANQ